MSDVDSPLGNFGFEGEVMTVTKDQCQLGQVSKIHLGYYSVIVYAGGCLIGLSLYFYVHILCCVASISFTKGESPLTSGWSICLSKANRIWWSDKVLF